MSEDEMLELAAKAMHNLRNNPAAKEVARGIWRAAQRDLATELREINPAPAGASFDALIASLRTNPEYDRRAARAPAVGLSDKGAPC